MAVSRHIFFDDAPWLAGSGQRMVHPDVPNGVAEALGCQSLRYHHQVDSSLTHYSSITVNQLCYSNAQSQCKFEFGKRGNICEACSQLQANPLLCR